MARPRPAVRDATASSKDLHLYRLRSYQLWSQVDGIVIVLCDTNHANYEETVLSVQELMIRYDTHIFECDHS